MKLKMIGIALLFGALNNTNTVHATMIDWSTTTLGGAFPNFSFPDSTLGTVNLSYSSDTENSGISTQFGAVETLLLGNTGGESLTMSWTNPVVNLDLPIWDIDAILGTVGESVALVSTAAISLVSLHSTDVWNPGSQVLTNDGTANPNTLANNFTVLNFADQAGFTAITFNWSIVGGGTGTMGIGNLSNIEVRVADIPAPPTATLLVLGILGLLWATSGQRVGHARI